MTNPEICGHCIRFRPSDGYCRKTGRYVNALALAKCFITEEPTPVESPKKAVRIRRQSAVSAAFRTEKTCPSCGRTLPLDEFVKCKRNPDGHDCYCKQCMAEKTRRYAKKKKERANN